MEKYSYLIVGAGFAGSVLAERLTSTGNKVIVIDRRNHVGGNCYDYYDKYGVLVHKYGPHYFRTDIDEVKEYLSKFTEWIPHEYIVKASINGKLYPLPINRSTINLFFNLSLKTKNEVEKFLEKIKVKITNPKNAEELILSQVGKEIYDAFFKNYTIKQWGVDPKKLDKSVTARIPIRTNDDPRYFTAKFQAMPKQGYTLIFDKLLEKSDILLNTTFESIKNKISFEKLIYTGPIDAYFNFKYGKLQYRSLKFIFENYNQEYFQTHSQINYPNEYEYTRIVEIKHATHQKCPDTTIVKEYPQEEGEQFYPFPTKENNNIASRYIAEAFKLKNTFFIGRLAQYKYLNMDQVIKLALDLFAKINTT